MGIVEVLRGLASLSVALFHLRIALPEGFLRGALEHGWMGVEVFFVISGFVMPLALTRADYRLSQFPRFVAKRVTRLDPPYIACIALILGLNYLSGLAPDYRGAPFEWEGARVASHLLYLTDILSLHWLSPVFWTLALEFQYYLALGLAFPLIGRASRLGFLGVLAVCLAGPFLAEGMTWVLPYLPLFAMGLVALRWREGKDPAAVAFAFWVLLTIVAGMEHGWPVAAVSLLAAILVATVRGGARGLAWLGTISYSLYLVHVPIGGRVVNLGDRVVSGDPARYLLFLVAVAVSLAASFGFYRLLELPSRRWASRIAYRPEPGPAA